MKPIIALISMSFLITLASCGHSKTVPQDTIVLKTTALQNGKETLALLKNKRIDTATVNGYLTYQIKDNPTTDVVQCIYEKEVDKGQVDGGLKEEVLFEIPKGDLALALTDSDLQKTKMLFGRYCFCRGQNGISKITAGNLNLTRQNETVLLALEFHTKPIPQAFDKISSK
jgi:hypothetical protein